MPSKFLNLSTDTTLGGATPSDTLAVSQKAIKTYVDNHSGGGGLPDQTGHAGEFLTTDGTEASWSGAIGYHPDLFDHKWADHQVNDVQWLRADTFSWQSGAVYQAAYQHLVDDIDNIKQSTSSYVVLNVGTYLRQPLLDAAGATYPCAYVAPAGSPSVVYAATGSLSTGNSVYDGYGSGATAIGVVSSVSYGSYPIPMLETVAGTEIIFYTAQDGHKIVYSNQENNVAAIYTATGVAWYYILDTVNQRFKLPRTKFGVTGLRDTVGNYVPETLPNLRGKTHPRDAYTGFAGSASASEGVFTTTPEGLSYYMGNVGATNAAPLGFDASNYCSTYQDNAPVKERATQMYLYFYVGNFTQSAIENTAGLNAELFNGKADVNLSNTASNIDFVVERQEPTAANNYTWYRKYKSGWLEQGGFIAAGTTSGTVSIPLPYSDTHYQVKTTPYSDGANFTTNITSYPASASRFTWNSYNNSATTKIWEAKGMAA